MMKIHQMVPVGMKKWMMKKRKIGRSPKGRHAHFGKNFQKKMRKLVGMFLSRCYG
jgi:hypothetical protein